MITGPVVGRLLEMLVFAARPRLVLEIGTFTGYGALAMAAVLPDGGRVVTCEIDPERARFARERFAASPHGDRIELVEGPALETIERLEEPVGLAWLDGDKDRNADYYEALVPAPGAQRPARLRQHAAPRHGGRPGEDAMAAAVAAFNDHVAADERTVQVLLPLSDGVTIVRRA